MSKKPALPVEPPPPEGRLRLEWVSADLVKPSDFNANKMTSKQFDRLKREIEENGMIDAPSVVPLDDGTYRVIAGHHRLDVMKALGWQEIPIQIIPGKKWAELDVQKFAVVKMNLIHGQLDPIEFQKLHHEMAAKYGEDMMEDMFAFNDKKEMEKILKATIKNMKKALPPEMHKQIDAAAKDAKTVDDLSAIVNMLFQQYGTDTDKSFMIFTYGKAENLYIQMSKPMKTAMDKVAQYCRATGVDINDVLAPLTLEYAKKLATTLPKSSENPLGTEDPEF